MDCVAATDRPKLPRQYAIDWSAVKTVQDARLEHDAYIATVMGREGVVAGYLLKLESAWFLCASDAQWLRDREAAVGEESRAQN